MYSAAAAQADWSRPMGRRMGRLLQLVHRLRPNQRAQPSLTAGINAPWDASRRSALTGSLQLQSNPRFCGAWSVDRIGPIPQPPPIRSELFRLSHRLRLPSAPPIPIPPIPTTTSTLIPSNPPHTHTTGRAMAAAVAPPPAGGAAQLGPPPLSFLQTLQRNPNVSAACIAGTCTTVEWGGIAHTGSIASIGGPHIL